MSGATTKQAETPFKQDYDFRPECLALPAMSRSEHAALKADIAANGLKSPIVLHPDGRILDGRTRYSILKELEGRTLAKADFISWDGKEGEEKIYVLSVNLMRRELSKSQRACVIVDMFSDSEQWSEGYRMALAKALHISDNYLKSARSLKAKSKALYAKVLDGTTSIKAAEFEASGAKKAAPNKSASKSAFVALVKKHPVLAKWIKKLQGNKSLDDYLNAEFGIKLTTTK